MCRTTIQKAEGKAGHRQVLLLIARGDNKSIIALPVADEG